MANESLTGEEVKKICKKAEASLKLQVKEKSLSSLKSEVKRKCKESLEVFKTTPDDDLPSIDKDEFRSKTQDVADFLFKHKHFMFSIVAESGSDYCSCGIFTVYDEKTNLPIYDLSLDFDWF